MRDREKQESEAENSWKIPRQRRRDTERSAGEREAEVGACAAAAGSICDRTTAIGGGGGSDDGWRWSVSSLKQLQCLTSC